MSHQRRHRGLPITFYPLIQKTDSRGNTQWAPDMTRPIETKCWIFPQRGAKAEVIGQQQINVVRVGIKDDLDVHLMSRATFRGVEWDVVTPPEYRNGVKRHTRHLSVDLRQRPANG